MKKNIYKMIVLALAPLFGCSDAIDIEQVGRLGEEEAFQSVSDLTAGVLGVYNNFDNTSAIQFNAVFTDQVSIGFDNGGQGISNGEYGFRLNPQSAISVSLWTRYYSALNSASRVIEAGPLVEVEEGEEDDYDEALGQAYALRAWAHFELLTYYSTDYTDPDALGVILLNFVPTVDQNLARNTNAEVFASIEEDLTKAESLISIQSDPTYVSLDFITALRARMALYRQDYDKADEYAADLLTSYSLANTAQYEAMFEDDDNTEIIFKLERTIGDSYDGQGVTGSGYAGGWAGAIFAFVNATVDGSPYYELSTDLFNLLSTSDVRYDVLVEPTSDLAAGIICVGKYKGSEGQPLMNDLKIFRASEMLLIRAEAAAAGGDLTQAATFIDQLRDVRFGTDQTTPVYVDQQEAYQDILNERRVELAFEGHRWVDLKRLGKRAGLSGIQRNSSDCAVNGACSLSIDDYRFTVPIPLVELDANPNIQPTEGYN